MNMVFAFMNLKGGVGKTKLNSYFGNYLWAKGHSVLLIDCDVSQHTTEVFRKHEGVDERSNKLDVVQYNTEYGNIDDIIENSRSMYDFVIVDLPGTVQQEGVLPLVAVMDYIVIPTTLEDEDLHSTRKFKEKLDELGVKYNVLFNNYEVQFFGGREHEEGEFKYFEPLFGKAVFPIGIRKERSLLQQNFAFGKYGDHKNTKRVEVALDQIYKNIV